MRFADPDTLFAPVARPPSGDELPRRRNRIAPPPASQALYFQSFPSWASLDANAHENAATAYLAAGVGLAVLDGFVRQEAPFAGAWRQRLALQAAAASAKLLRLREDDAALRDATHLAVSDTAGPAGQLHRLWRNLAAAEPDLGAERIRSAGQLIDGLGALDAVGLSTVLEAVLEGAGDPVTGAAQAATAVSERIPGPEGEILAFWAADLVLARRLRWRKAAPLLLSSTLKPALRRGPTGRRPRPGDADWSHAAAQAYALAAAEAHGLAAQLSRRTNVMMAVAPKLRARRAGQVVELLLVDDCVAPTRIARKAGLSDRASRRLFERLVELGAIRELSGRPSFRLYGL